MYEKLVNYAAKQLELDPAEITPDATFEKEISRREHSHVR